MEKFHQTWIYCVICLLAGCAIGGGQKPTFIKTLQELKDICGPNGVQTVTLGTNDDGEQIVKSFTCFNKTIYQL